MYIYIYNIYKCIYICICIWIYIYIYIYHIYIYINIQILWLIWNHVWDRSSTTLWDMEYPASLKDSTSLAPTNYLKPLILLGIPVLGALFWVSRNSWWLGFLVGGWATPLKNMKVNWDDKNPNIWEKKMFQTTNQFYRLIWSLTSFK